MTRALKQEVGLPDPSTSLKLKKESLLIEEIVRQVVARGSSPVC